MIVISGKYRGRKLKTLERQNTRPTSARVKEDIFNILNNYFIFENKISLDLFAGSGSLSVEALSRGIEFAYINDHYKPALSIIKQNLKNINLDQYQIWNLDYDKVLENMNYRKIKVDLIFLDPPFPRLEYYDICFNNIINFNLLNPWGVIVTESPIELNIDNIELQGLKLLKMKAFKNKFFYLFRKEGE